MSRIMPLHRMFSLAAEEWFADVLPVVKQLKNFTQYSFIQEAGDMVILPSGWYHIVVNLEHSSSVSFNMLNEHTVVPTFEAICQRTQWSLGFSLKACTVLSELRPLWYAQTCCPKFLRNPSEFRIATPLDEALVFVHSMDVG